MLHTHSFIFAFPESWNYLTYQHSFHNHWKLKLSTYIYIPPLLSMLQHTYIILYNCYAWRSSISWLHRSYYYCILSQHISKTHKQYKIKKLVSTPTHLPFIYHSLSRPRERVCKAYYLYFLVYIFIIIIGTEGEVHCVRMYLLMYCTIGVLCTYYD